jgi:hypothetical protein
VIWTHEGGSTLVYSTPNIVGALLVVGLALYLSVHRPLLVLDRDRSVSHGVLGFEPGLQSANQNQLSAREIRRLEALIRKIRGKVGDPGESRALNSILRFPLADSSSSDEYLCDPGTPWITCRNAENY